jgi:hypothetical protein
MNELIVLHRTSQL